MTNSQLTVFLSVCQTHNMTETARKLNYTQAHISNIIHEIEDEYGYILFDRKNGMMFTEAGKLIYQYYSENQARHNHLLQNLKRINQQSSLRIGMYPSLSDSILPKIYSQMHRQFPDLILHFVVNNKTSLSQLWEKKEIDLLICDGYIDNIPSSCITLYQDEFHFYKSSRSTLPTTLSLIELSTQSMIVREKGSSTRNLLDEKFRHHGLPLNVLVESISLFTIVEMVINDAGISFFPSSYVRDLVEDGLLTPINTPGFHFTDSLYLYIQPDLKYNLSLQEAVNTFVSQFSEWIETSHHEQDILNMR